MTEKLVEKIAENAREEFKVFRTKELQKSKEEIFADNYRIRFYDELFNFLTEEGPESYLSEDDVAIIAANGTMLISFLYDYYLGCEFSSINSWEEIGSLIRSYIDRDRYSKL